MKITLYELPGCPFCMHVRRYLDEKKIEHTIIDVPGDRMNPTRQKIAQESGVSTVPVIEVDGKWIGGSNEIIEWLETNA